MNTRSILAPAAGLFLLLGGCTGTGNRGLESVHQPVVAQQSFALDLAVAGDSLARGEQERLTGWLDALRLGYGDRISVNGYRTDAARSEIGGVVAAYGLLLSDEVPALTQPVAPGAVRVLVSRARASVPGCPDYSRDSSHEFESATSSNFGCAANTNLAAMVADPADLIRGRSGASYTDPEVAGKAITTFRKAQPTGNGNTVKTVGTGAK